MPDGAIGQHEGFLHDVGCNVDVYTSRMREDILTMLGRYVNQQHQSIKESLHAEAVRRENAILDERRKIEVTAVGALREVERQKETMSRLVGGLGNANRRMWMQKRFHDWELWVLRKRHRKKLYKTIECHINGIRAYHVYTQWRLLAAARRHHRLAVAEQSQWKCSEAELVGQLEVLNKVIEEERRHSENLEEKMRTAFVRGICALNKEAVQVLKGAQLADPQASPLCPGGMRATRTSPPRYGATRGVSNIFDGSTFHTGAGTTMTAGRTADAEDATPLTGQFLPEIRDCSPTPTKTTPARVTPPRHHACYAPATCAYSARTLPHQPFVVSVDPAAVRSYGDVPASKKPPYVARRPPMGFGSRSTR
ncbi:uncharacterized protein TEOVI_000420400 [Trypanosoma equiperdum]|uniref:Centrosomal protein POC5 n=1 Tax=Trypanosoma equiperdum TaxID=5694 RepID=A0A1G4IJB9_TRYEQ|nr:hypothetical protein, conserved [Trypanosoma equiperdum]